MLVVGAGGVGGYYAAELHRHGAEVAIVARGASLEAIRARGLRVRSRTHGDWTARLRALAPEEVGDAGGFDWIWIATKAFDTPAVVDRIRPAVGETTLVMSLQNGVENEDLLAAAFGEARVLGAMTVLIGSHVVEPGVVEHTGESRLVFGVWPRGESERVRGLGEYLAAHGIRAIVSADVEAELWKKLMLNDAANGLSALTRLDTRALTHDPQAGPLMKRMMAEVHAVAVASGVRLAADDADRMFALLHGFDAIRTSTLWDVEHGRPTEVEALVGTVVRRGLERGVPTPVNDLVYTLLTAMERARRATG